MADIENPATKSHVRGGLCRAWDVLEERRRVLMRVTHPDVVARHARPAPESARRRQTRVSRPTPVPVVGIGSPQTGSDAQPVANQAEVGSDSAG